MATYSYITSSGTAFVDTSTIKSEVESEYRTIFGLSEGQEIDSSTNEGRLVDAEVTSRVSVATNNALMANQINPNLAYSWAFDALYKLLGGERDAAEQSTCDCFLGGVSGTVIPSGSYVKDDNKNMWFLVAQTTIPASGSVTASFRSEDYGAISAGISEINSIVSGVTGWETVTNEVSAVEGKEEQSLVSAKLQRRVEIGANSNSTAYSVIAAVNKLEGVEGVKFRENNTSSSLVVDGITIPEKSTWICVDGGATSEIGLAYYKNRFGTAFYGFSETVTESVTDPESGQSFNVLIDRPTDVPMKITITIKVSSSSATVENIKDAIIAYANGEVDGGAGFVLGEDVSPVEIGWGVNQYISSSGVFVRSVQATKLADDTLTSDTINISLWEKPSILPANISVTVIS